MRRISLLACGIRQSSSQIYIIPDTLVGVEGYRSYLVLGNAPEDAQEYSWHRGANDTEGNMIISYDSTSDSRQYGPMYSGREALSNAGNLLIIRAQLNDTGNYTVRVDAINGTQRATGWLKIQELEIPGISVNTSSVVEDMESVAAVCDTNATNVTWYVDYIPVSSNSRMTVSPDGKTLIIQRFSHSDKPLQFGPYYVLLWTNPNDFNGVLSAEIGSQVEMECVSYSRPESKYRWMHNGSLLSFSEKNITLLNLTWDQMGRYRCIGENPVTQLTFYQEVQVQAPCHIGVHDLRPGGQDQMGKEVRDPIGAG
ncbi:Carcinoembryonic antigen-related cell adhesion molecule 18 [Camelus dromedarius]|uniref:Carcinoembryonic antigen-related cell adhesion molecule 18 n=1 Tax=Camelus dromedarius TaxID=9838 RepID=A0A5N4DRK1_CAMDR|nr:Carcinoembryonic antigen-related cell adhesion molecule 18 [Camelus dromedarius]